MNDRVRLRLIVGRLGFQDIGHEGLRIAIDQREPAALHLHGDAVPLLEDVRCGMEIDVVAQHLAGGDRLGPLIAAAETAAEDVVGNHALALSLIHI